MNETHYGWSIKNNGKRGVRRGRNRQGQTTWYFRVLVKIKLHELYLNIKKPWKKRRQGSDTFKLVILKDYLKTRWSRDMAYVDVRKKIRRMLLGSPGKNDGNLGLG